MPNWLSSQMLRGQLRPVIIKAKYHLMKVIIWAARFYPEPTYENLAVPNSKVLLRIKDKYLEYELNQDRVDLIKALFRIFIGEYEHDRFYRYRFDWFIEMVIKSYWVFRKYGRPDEFWNETPPYGGKDPMYVPVTKKLTCECGGDIIKVHLYQEDPGAWSSSCIKCFKRYTVIE